jgi:hypothetical protein
MHTAAAGGTASTWGLGVCVGGATWERAHGFDGWKHGEVGRVQAMAIGTRSTMPQPEFVQSKESRRRVADRLSPGG